MDLRVNSVHFDADRKLVEFVNGKVGKLDLFVDNIIAGEVFLRLDKSADSVNKIAEIKLSVPGKELFAKKQCKSFEEATDSACQALKRQVKKYKSKSK